MNVNFLWRRNVPRRPKPDTFGASERIMGDWLAKKGQRNNIVLATEVTGSSARNRGIDYIRNGASLNKRYLNWTGIN